MAVAYLPPERCCDLVAALSNILVVEIGNFEHVFVNAALRLAAYDLRNTRIRVEIPDENECHLSIFYRHTRI